MDEQLKSWAGSVVTHGNLVGLLADYRAPNDKIYRWMQEGALIPLKRGLYMVASGVTADTPASDILAANHVYGPSYVSLEYALFHHRLLIERPYQITSVTLRRGKIYDTPRGRFSYQRVPEDYYAIGILREQPTSRMAYLIASPEKALCDWLALTPGLSIHSVGGLRALLFEDMRLNEDTLHTCDGAITQRLLTTGFRRQRLYWLAKLLEDL